MDGSEAPQWLRDAWSVHPSEHAVLVEGVPVHYRSWGEAGAPAVVLVHGGLAHGRWWDHIAPLLAGSQVVAIDLSGHGDSGRRAVGYDMAQWAHEIVAVTEDAGLVRPVLVGHSMGGCPSVAACLALPDARGVVTVDTRFNDVDWRPRTTSRTFPSLEAGVAAFAPVHPVPGITVDPALLRRVAEASLTQDGDRWRWKFDERFEVRQLRLRELLPRLRAPLAQIRPERGVLTAAAAVEMRELTPAPTVEVALPAAGHNPMIEQPVALVGVLRTLLALWPQPGRTWTGSAARGAEELAPSST